MSDADTRSEFATGWRLLLACVAGVAFGSALAECAGSHNVSFAVAAALFAIGGPAVLTLGRYPRFAD